MKILSEIPDVLSKYAIPANRKIYPTWDFYEKVFLSQGLNYFGDEFEY